jgi:hypothetical protein
MTAERFSSKRPELYADRIWRDMLSDLAGADRLLKQRGFLLKASDFIDPASGADSATLRPSDRLIVYALRQLLVFPGVYRPRLPRKRKTAQKFDERAAELILAEGRRRIVKGGRKAALKKTNVDAALQPSPKNQDTVKNSRAAYAHLAEEIRVGVSGVVNKWRQLPSRPITPSMLFNSPELQGPEAIKCLLDIAAGDLLAELSAAGSSPDEEVEIRPDDLGWLEEPDSFGGQPFHFEKGEPASSRARALEQVCDAAFSWESPHQVINAYAPGSRTDLTALAGELFNREHRRRRGSTMPILYVALHGRSLDTPKDSYAELAHKIWRFYDSISPGADASQPNSRPDLGVPRGLDQTVQMIRAVQRLMITRPAVIIFDGYRSGRHEPKLRGFSLHTLKAAISGDRLFDLLERLTMIPTGSAGSIDVKQFRQNRFVVLSDQPLYSESDDFTDAIAIHPHPALALLTGTSIRIPPPPRETLRKSIQRLGFQQPDQIAWLRKEVAAVPTDPESLRGGSASHMAALKRLAGAQPFAGAALTESALGVLSALLKLGKKPPFRDLPDPSQAGTVRTLVQGELIPLLRERQSPWLLFLRLVAITPGGVRPKTLARVYQHYLEELGPGSASPSRQEVNRSIAEMLEVCHGVVELLWSDHLEALQGRPLPLLFRQNLGSGKEEIPADRAILFASEEVREAVFDDLMATVDKSEIAHLHFLLAEEAYEQFTHLARYDDLQGEESLHRSARLLAAIFHGAASLGDNDLRSVPLHEGVGRFLPSDPIRRWIKLYSFAYRRNLDRPPQRHLIRSFDAAQTNLDLLLALARPQLCHRPEEPPDDWRPPDLRSGFPEDRQEVATKVMRQFALELRKAANAAGRNLGVDWPTAQFGGDAKNEVKLAIDEQINRLTFAELMRGEEVDRLSETILARIGAELGHDNARKYLRAISRRVSEILHGRETDLMSKELEGRLAAKAQVPPGKWRDLIDFLNLYGEVLGVEADRDYGLDLDKGIEAPTEPVMRKFVESFSAFYVAEFMRNQLFWEDPNGSRDVIRGRAARGFIRVSLKLERFRVTLQGRSRGSRAPGGWFWRHAHGVADELAKHLSRFPRERVAMLILDSIMARYWESRNSPEYRTFLNMALGSLASAEPLLLKLGMHNRLRQRFALERGKVLMEMARLDIQDGDRDSAEQLLDMADLDIVTVEKLATNVNVLWKNLAAAAHRKSEALRQALSTPDERPIKLLPTES